jgi:hypothetical protein
MRLKTSILAGLATLALAGSAGTAEAKQAPEGCTPRDDGTHVCFTAIDTGRTAYGPRECMIREDQRDLVRNRYRVFRETTEIYDSRWKRISRTVFYAQELNGYIIIGTCCPR